MNKVHDDRDENRFELVVDGDRAIAAYQLRGDTIVFTHTVVPPALEGQGIASTLIRAALDSARERHLRVVPQCSFVAAFIARHPEYGDLVG